jgi:Cu/Ag efflux protein CusF
MKRLFVVVAFAAIAAFAWFSLPTPARPDPEQPSGGHANHAGDPSAFADGVVLSVDRAANSVTISHGPLYNLGMPPMTMGFRTAGPTVLERTKAGDKVRFHADVVGGVFTVMKIETAN